MVAGDRRPFTHREPVLSQVFIWILEDGKDEESCDALVAVLQASFGE